MITLSTPRSPSDVTVNVALDISELRSRPLRARLTRSLNAADKCVARERLAIEVRWRDHAAAAQRDRNSEVHVR